MARIVLRTNGLLRLGLPGRAMSLRIEAGATTEVIRIDRRTAHDIHPAGSRPCAGKTLAAAVGFRLTQRDGKRAHLARDNASGFVRFEAAKSLAALPCSRGAR
jgi:hypothetical protein